jgi:uncharacterized protein YggE
MKKLILFPILLLINSCSTDNDQSIQLNVNQTIQIPIEMVTVSVMVTEFGTDPESVERAGYENLAKVVNLLRDNGMQDDDLEIEAGELTSNHYRDEAPYQFSSTIVFDLMDTDQIDTYRRAIIGAGGTSFQISSFGNPDEESIFDNAYQNAIDVARERADRLLSNQSVKTGEILTLQENIQDTIDISANLQMDRSESTQLRAGMERVDPIFSKEFYTRNIQFNIEFELIRD